MTDSFVTGTAAQILRYLPDVAAWTTGVIVAIIMLRHGGGRAEKLFLAGSILFFIVNLLNPFIGRVLIPWLRDTSDIPRARMSWLISVPSGLLSLAGLICLVSAFWLRFRVKKGAVPGA